MKPASLQTFWETCSTFLQGSFFFKSEPPPHFFQIFVLSSNTFFQDSLHTPSMGICCANRTELQLLYGSDNKDHADPIWSGDPVPSMRTPSKRSSIAPTEVTTSTETSHSVRVIATALEHRAPVDVLIDHTDARLNITVRSRGNSFLPIVISDSDVIAEESGPGTGLLSSRGAASASDDASDGGNSIVAIKEVGEVTTRVADPQEKLIQSNKPALEVIASPSLNETESLQTDSTGNLTATDRDSPFSEEEKIIALPETLENSESAVVNSSAPSSLAEQADFGTNSTQSPANSENLEKRLEEIFKAEEKTAEEQKEQENSISTKKLAAAERVLEASSKKEEKTPKENPEDTNLAIANVNVEPKDGKAPNDVAEFSEKPLDEQNYIKVSDIEKSGQWLEREEEKQIRYSCERQPYR